MVGVPGDRRAAFGQRRGARGLSMDSEVASESQAADPSRVPESLVKSHSYRELAASRWIPCWIPEASWKPPISAEKSLIRQSVSLARGGGFRHGGFPKFLPGAGKVPGHRPPHTILGQEGTEISMV